MTNRPGFNYAAFDEAAAHLRGQGVEVISPSEIAPDARAAAVASPDGDPAAHERATGQSRGSLLAQDVQLIIESADVVAVLPGWEQSAGALVETFAAATHGKPVVFYPNLEPVPAEAMVGAWIDFLATPRASG